MKKTLAIAIISAISIYASTSSANEGVYVTGKIGTSVVNTYGSHSDFSGDDIEHGSSKLGSATKGVLGGGIAIGYDFYDQYQLPMRLELDATFRGAGHSKGMQSVDVDGDNTTVSAKNKVRMTTYMLNGYYDFHNSSAFTPYVSAGIGLANLKLKNHTQATDDDEGDSISGSNNNFAWGVGVGTKYAVTDNFAIDASYKYINAGKAKASRSDNEDGDNFAYHTQAKAASNDFMIGVTYAF